MVQGLCKVNNLNPGGHRRGGSCLQGTTLHSRVVPSWEDSYMVQQAPKVTQLLGFVPLALFPSSAGAV